MLLGGGNLVYRKKKADGVSKEHGEFEETVKDVLILHDKLLKMGFEGPAEDELKIHDNLLEIKEKKAKPDLGNTELKENRDTLKNSSLFLRDDTGHIYGTIGVEKGGSESK